MRLIENIKKNSPFKILSVEIPGQLPDFIEDPSDYIASLRLDKSIFPVDLLITYILHPDITPGIIRFAGENGVRAVIIAGGEGRAGYRAELKKISEKFNMHIEIHDICCDIEKCGNDVVDEFAAYFGRPRVRIIVKNDRVSDIKVLRGAPCGSTWHMVHGLIGVSVDDAPAKAGLLVQQYPCRAQRGMKGGIHKAAELHKIALETAEKVEE